MDPAEFAEQLDGVITVFLHKTKESTLESVPKTFNQLKDAIKHIYSIEAMHVALQYEDDNCCWTNIRNEKDYFEALKCVDAIRLYLKIDFDEAKVIQSKPVLAIPESSMQIDADFKPWSCARCQCKNDKPGEVKCKICGFPKKK